MAHGSAKGDVKAKIARMNWALIFSFGSDPTAHLSLARIGDKAIVHRPFLFQFTQSTDSIEKSVLAIDGRRFSDSIFELIPRIPNGLHHHESAVEIKNRIVCGIYVESRN